MTARIIPFPRGGRDVVIRRGPPRLALVVIRPDLRQNRKYRLVWTDPRGGAWLVGMGLSYRHAVRNARRIAEDIIIDILEPGR
jgi:hypothetical protein